MVFLDDIYNTVDLNLFIIRVHTNKIYQYRNMRVNFNQLNICVYTNKYTKNVIYFISDLLEFL